MLSEIEKNEELSSKYSKYELVRIVFLLLKEKKRELDKAHKRVELTQLVDQIIEDLGKGTISINN